MDKAPRLPCAGPAEHPGGAGQHITGLRRGLPARRRRVGRLGGALLLVALLACQASSAAQAPASAPPARPNVLLIVIDDLYYKIGAYGYAVRTPNLARLAEQGRRFDRAYVQYPLCNPSRVSFMTGWRPEKTRIWANWDSPRRNLEGAVPLQEHFRANGYFTARVGKVYHTPFEGQFHWDVAEDPRPASVPQPAGPAGASQPAEDEEFSIRIRATEGGDEDEPDGRSARRAAQLIEQRRGAPFLIAVGFLRPHGPWVAPRKYFQMYPPREVQLPPQAPRDLDDVPRVALKRGAEPDIPRARRQEALAAYYACVTFVDAQVGVLLDSLDRLGLWDTTTVVVVSDHGIQRGEHGLWRKNVLFEESTRVPLIVAGYGVEQPGAATGELAELVDVYPTLMELCRLPVPEGLEGTSLVPLLRDPRRSVKAAAFTVSNRGRQLGRSVRTRRFRYTEWKANAAELYDHDADPNEYHNLARDPRHARTVEEMRGLLGAAPARPAAPSSPPSPKRPEMVLLKGGTFRMGTNGSFPFEGPAHTVTVRPFWMDTHEVTVAAFRRFVEASGYRSEAERYGWSLVFDVRTGQWTKTEGADWRRPEGPGSRAGAQEPVTQVSWNDALAYARWAGKRLPTEAEWEFAARGGLAGSKYAWGDELRPQGRYPANWWQGLFPQRNTGEDGYLKRAPAGRFPPNSFGLYDMAGNVWEWCFDWFGEDYYGGSPRLDPRGPAGGRERVIRGGSWMCSENYCTGYRAAARSHATPDSGLNNLGFRCARSG